VPRPARMAARRTAALLEVPLRPVPMVGLHTGHRLRAVRFTVLAGSTPSGRGLPHRTTGQSSQGWPWGR
jgi:hypothetical protein